MANLNINEMKLLNKIFKMSDGYVLDFSDSTLKSFFNQFDIDIHADKYCRTGRSKAKKLSEFFKIESNQMVGKILSELLKYKADHDTLNNYHQTEEDKKLFDRCQEIVDYLLSTIVIKSKLHPTTMTYLVEEVMYNLYSCEELESVFNHIKLRIEFPRFYQGFFDEYNHEQMEYYIKEKTCGAIRKALLEVSFEDLKHLIEELFNPINFIDNKKVLDELMSQFNHYLEFDNFILAKVNNKIILQDHINPSIVMSEQLLLSLSFADLPLENLNIDRILLQGLKQRVEEINKCMKAEAYLASVLLCGSLLETIFLCMAKQYPKSFNTAENSPKDKTNNVKKFGDWTLHDFVEVTYKIGLIDLNVKRFCHPVREFRNYIHPFQQYADEFNPNKATSDICRQVSFMAIQQIAENISKLN